MMRKITSLLHDVTLLNFPLLVTLVKRYRGVGVITPMIIGIIGSYIYFSQKTIYQTTLPFTARIDNEGNSVNDIASMLGEKKKGINEGEIMSLSTNWKFINRVAQKVLESADIEKFDYSDINKNNKITSYILNAGCKDIHQCKVDRVAAVIGSFFMIKKSLDENRYTIEVKSLSRELNIALSSALLEMIKENRIEAMKASIAEKRKLSEELIEQKSKEFTDNNFYELVEEKAALEQSVITMRNRLEDLGRNLIQNSMIVTSLESKIKHVKETEKVTITTNDRDKYQRYSNLKEDIQRIRENITVLGNNISTGKAKIKQHEELLARIFLQKGRKKVNYI
jgi:DNA-binding FrmR family transcriptional regulator